MNDKCNQLFYSLIFRTTSWKKYNPITTDISSLTANRAPNAELLGIFTLIYGICFLLFTLGMTAIAYEKYHRITKVGFLIFMIMSIISLIGYGYLKKEKLKKLGKVAIATASLIIIFGFLNPIAIALQLDILGLTERLVIFTLMIFTSSYLLSIHLIKIIELDYHSYDFQVIPNSLLYKNQK
jgi:uncharacterized membrane protein